MQADAGSMYCYIITRQFTQALCRTKNHLLVISEVKTPATTNTHPSIILVRIFDGSNWKNLIIRPKGTLTHLCCDH
ncbi:hypothetical protein Y1Q_0018778 [Alligator mississippiensis]|uniref:Uncharacterized protein n=1 Tax=Alligator mississippiensis TaxID=8496 RepID=A0A151NSJ4_ALLMI|nr:hypothetical protein Y1Q_0018778 [Alligator mississippiensis]